MLAVRYLKAVVLLLLLGQLLGLSGRYALAQYLELDERLLQRIEADYGIEARGRVADWQTLMVDTNARPQLADEQKMTSANDFFNRVAWVSDLEHWGLEDYWATPVETLATNGGDCEDFSIGKYFTLKDTGVDNGKLRITYVKALNYDQAHMVLAYYPTPGGEPLILDNINKTILPASQRTDLLPIYSFNGESLWLARSRGNQLRSDSMTSLPQWREVNRRLLRELSR
ncbi:sulfate adenylyltransferase [Exilibacterium tricleocarpae]|uniref:Sulfate adenylyltransferase n=1 Tax=Exilibacterium tricleocarpae TaxID=2591008 RepID=A0A545TNQ9_9GAMM|nr:transglutaminase-like cysteine peptidase [Exilibacterium tricleocarpae]TQV78854.1 sulfate adenylyltransferase [Exilibacterium tricleocarpae]